MSSLRASLPCGLIRYRFDALKPVRSDWNIIVADDQSIPDDDGDVRIDPASLDSEPDIVLSVLDTIVQRAEQLMLGDADAIAELVQYCRIVGRRAIDD